MHRIIRFGAALVLVLWVAACGSGKQSAVEGMLVDGNGKPVAGVKIAAAQIQPIKGYEQFEAVTKSDGTFHIRGLFPSSRYVLKPWSDKWTTETAVAVESGPQGETAILPEPMVMTQAFSKSGGGLVTDLATGATRFTFAAGGVIADSLTGLDWLVGPEQNNGYAWADYAQAEQWARGLTVAGGGWRMPTRQELAGLYAKGIGDTNMDPMFKITGSIVWAEPRDSSSAWAFSFAVGGEGWERRRDSRLGAGYGYRVFAVRSRR